MDDGPIDSIIFVLLVLINVVYYGFSAAMEQLNIKEVEEKAQELNDRKSKRLVRLIHEPQNFIDTIQLVITLLNMLIGWIYMEKFISYTNVFLLFIVKTKLNFQVGVELLAFMASVLTFIIVLYIFLLFFVSLPKKIALHNPKRWAYCFVDIIYIMNRILLPVTGIISISTKGIVKLLGMNPNNDEGDVTEEEIIHMVNEGHEQGLIEAGEAEMISNILNIMIKKLRIL